MCLDFLWKAPLILWCSARWFHFDADDDDSDNWDDIKKNIFDLKKTGKSYSFHRFSVYTYFDRHNVFPIYFETEFSVIWMWLSEIGSDEMKPFGDEYCQHFTLIYSYYQKQTHPKLIKVHRQIEPSVTGVTRFNLAPAHL